MPLYRLASFSSEFGSHAERPTQVPIEMYVHQRASFTILPKASKQFQNIKGLKTLKRLKTNISKINTLQKN